MLPELFLQRMEQMLGAEYDDFLKSYDKPRTPSLRINSLKDKGEKLLQRVDFLKDPVSWAQGGFYYEAEAKPGRHPYHEAGVYYIQEASAMLPAESLSPEPGDMVLDLCAAPGGKSTQLAARMQGQGVLLCNEIHPARARILSENIERMGIANAIVTNHEPDFLAERFAGCFDKIMVDAPCSGEGMFRKNENAITEWSPENVEMCASRQDTILESADRMLKPGGRMVYSTCTFAPQEDEGTIDRFLKKHGQYTLLSMKRLWPHKIDGEGHFVAVLEKAGNAEAGECLWTLQKECSRRECEEWTAFQAEYIRKALPGILLRFGEQIYLAPLNCPALQGVKVLRPGLHLGTLKKNRFEPAHALALALQPQEVRLGVDLSVQEASAYLQGQTFQSRGEKGWHLISVDGYSLGWGKLAGDIMKNHYPKGLRRIER